MGSNQSASALEEEIGRLADLPRGELVERWITAHGHPPPRGVKRGLLERDFAYQLQARTYGGLKARTAKSLLAIARGEKMECASSARDLKPGIRLVREWGGVTHQVDVIDTGFDWNGQRFASLSAVARAITGARWSGPRFFGL